MDLEGQESNDNANTIVGTEKTLEGKMESKTISVMLEAAIDDNGKANVNVGIVKETNLENIGQDTVNYKTVAGTETTTISGNDATATTTEIDVTTNETTPPDDHQIVERMEANWFKEKNDPLSKYNKPNLVEIRKLSKEKAIDMMSGFDDNSENEANDDENATAPNPAPTATGTDMQELTTLLQQLVNNGNNNNNRNNNAGANHQATLDLPWNPTTLPPPVKDRYYRRDEFLTRDDMKDFPITYTDSSGNETIVRQNYYLHNLGSGRNDQRLITRSGDCFDLTRASDKSKKAARDKLFLSGFPQLKDAT
eukprot:jgi/Psemu1/56245/gm1.56245_g